jgi:hypothetical protein
MECRPEASLSPHNDLPGSPAYVRIGARASELGTQLCADFSCQAKLRTTGAVFAPFGAQTRGFGSFVASALVFGTAPHPHYLRVNQAGPGPYETDTWTVAIGP